MVVADSNSSVAYSGTGGTNAQLDAAANTVVTNGNYVTVNHQPALYKFSTDGGSTMTDDPTGATHIGLIKDPNQVMHSDITTYGYIWIPLS